LIKNLRLWKRKRCFSAKLSGLNETLQSIQSAQETHKELQNHFVTLVMFNSEHVSTVMNMAPASAIRLLKDKDYQPSATTPLFDAMGNSLSKLRHQLDSEKNNQVLVTIITDGYENASREYSGAMIKQLVEELRVSGWVFTYIGANQDVDAVADSFSIKNKMSFDADAEGVSRMMKKERDSRAEFYRKVSKKMNGECVNLEFDYFEDGGSTRTPKKGKPEKKENKQSFFSKLKNVFNK
jgi:hypothetical protein